MGSMLEIKKTLAQLLLEAKTEYINNLVVLSGGRGIVITDTWVPIDIIKEAINSMRVILRNKSVSIEDITIPFDSKYSNALSVLSRGLMNFVKSTITGKDFPEISDISGFERLAEI